MTRSESEIVRAQQIITRLRGVLDGVESVLKDPAPIGYDVGDAVIHNAAQLVSALAKLDAYARAENDFNLFKKGAIEQAVRHGNFSTAENIRELCSFCGQAKNSASCQARHP